jgi:hypothetical protein
MTHSYCFNNSSAETQSASAGFPIMAIVGREQSLQTPNSVLAEGVGFEPTFAKKGENGFQDRHHKPLGHPSQFADSTSKQRLQAMLPELRQVFGQIFDHANGRKCGR